MRDPEIKEIETKELYDYFSNKKPRSRWFFNVYIELCRRLNNGEVFPLEKAMQTNYWEFIRTYRKRWKENKNAIETISEMYQRFNEGVKLFYDIKRYGILFPLDMTIDYKGIKTLEAGSQRLAIAHTLGIEKIKVKTEYIIKLSIVIPVLNSHEILRRQLLHFNKMNLSPHVELIIVDDGSDPPLNWIEDEHSCIAIDEDYDWNISIYETHDKRPWTWALARNFGAKKARGDYYLMMDLDYIITESVINDALAFTGDKMRFKREFGVLDEDGNLTQDIPTLLKYGLSPERIPTRGVKLAPHSNNFCMQKDVFWMLGGYREDRIGLPYPQGEDSYFKKAWTEALNQGKVKDSDYRPTLYMFPNGQFCGDVDYNPFGLFHNLSRKSKKNKIHERLISNNPC